MTEEKKENRFEKKQPLRHPLARVVVNGEQVKINQQVYHILINKESAIDIDLLRHKYDPYLDQYDFLVGDISSDHLRLKGFYKDIVRTAIDRKEKAIGDYLSEYCNPGCPYFILELVSPVHHYHYWHARRSSHRPSSYYQNKKRYFVKRKQHHLYRSRRSPEKKRKASNTQIAKHKFVIKRRKS